jgi:hypothetical protein
VGKLLDWPELQKMEKEELVKLIQEIREDLLYAEECCCEHLSEKLRVDPSV